MVTIDTTHDDTLREVPFARETIYDGHILHVEKWRVTCRCLTTAIRCWFASTAWPWIA